MGGKCFELRKKSEKQESLSYAHYFITVYVCYVLHLMMSYRTPTHGIYIYTYKL